MAARATLALAILAAAVLAQPAEAAKGKRPTCAKDATHTVRQSAQVRVYSELVDQGNGVMSDRLTGCWRASGRKMALASAYSSSGDDYSYRFVRLSGGRVALSTSARFGQACKYGCPPETRLGSASIAVFDIRRGRRARTIALPYPAALSDLALTRRGRVAWIIGSEVRAVDRAGERTLDTGVAPGSLDGGVATVSWLRGGAKRVARLN